MPVGFKPPPKPTTRPAWYRRLPPALQRIAAASDRVPSLPFGAGPRLRAAVASLPEGLASGDPRVVREIAQGIADGICSALRVPPVAVGVELRRPADRRGELHGLYAPGSGRGRDVIRVWMITARRGQVVAYRTFLRTLLHEVCHHLDYTYLGLRDSLHTQGFYQRESSLFYALGASDVDSG